MHLVYIFAGLSVAFAALCAAFHLRGKLYLKTVFKSAASLAFIAAAAAAYFACGSSPRYFVFVISALSLGLLGDVLLAVNVFLKGKKKSLAELLGGAAFLAGHAVYIALFLSLASFNYLMLIGIAGLPALFAAAFLIKFKRADGASAPLLDMGKYRFPAIGYAAVLSLMLFSAVNLYVFCGGLKASVVLAAATLFAASDVFLALYNFLTREFKFKKYFIVFVMLLYYTAQSLLAISIAL